MCRARALGAFTLLFRYLSLMAVTFSLFCSPAWAGSARFITGQNWGVGPGGGMVWNTTLLRYYTDAGPLSPTVSHAQADRMVAAAAAVWSVPVSSISLQQGGTLAEDVSPDNVYFDGQQFVFPADVQAANESNMPVSVIYDQDGSLIDLLLGEDASDPDGCLQNGVVGDVDDIWTSDGSLRHATLVLNGRCVGTDPEQLMQMQYQLGRAFGRILGLSWSQTNDNVFTAQRTVTTQQIAYWPIMHPLDVICGNYTYQCLSNPFTLRPDDLNTLTQLYPIYEGNVPAGKQATEDDALFIWGSLSFPTGQGMDWINVTAHRNNAGVEEDWETASVTTGSYFQQALPTPVNPDVAVLGTGDGSFEGWLLFRRIPLNGVSDVKFTTEAINPLYTGDAAVGAYVRPPVTPSGSTVNFTAWSARSNGDGIVGSPVAPAPDAASSCSPGQDGYETSPAVFAVDGWQTGRLCGWGHNSWRSISAASGHTWTLEVSATDETGATTANKLQPVLGVWMSSDEAGVLPTVASQAVPFNSFALGTTQLQMDSSVSDQTYRISISDQYGAGRPDFTYVARLLYISTVIPATVSTVGGQITINGSGFRQGNQILVNNVPALVLSWTATKIVAQVASIDQVGARLGRPVTIAVVDTETGGAAQVERGLRYQNRPDQIQLVSAPNALTTGVVSSTPLSVRIVASDGQTPVANASVQFSVTQGSAALSVCQVGGVCTVTTDGSGLAQVTVEGLAPGSVVVQVSELSGAAPTSVTFQDIDPVRKLLLKQRDHYVASGFNGRWTLQWAAFLGDVPASDVHVTWHLSAGLMQQAAGVVTDADGIAQLTLSASGLAPGATETATACLWTSVCATWTLHGVGPNEWLLQGEQTSAGQNTISGALSPVSVQVTDGNGDAVEGAPVSVFQRVLAWQGTCSEVLRCASAPVLATSQSAAPSDGNGVLDLTPLYLSGIPGFTEIAVSSGLNGFLAFTLVEAP